jgi:hypothetical protein
MTGQPTGVVLVLALSAFVVSCGSPSRISHGADHGITDGQLGSMFDSPLGKSIHTIVMPHDEPVFPPGPGRDEFVTACVVCHSPRYITLQPRFSRTTWTDEVHKMKDVYGAHITDEQVLEITDYLMSIDGAADAPHARTNGSYGE